MAAMSELSRDDSLSPVTRSPGASSPAPNPIEHRPPTLRASSGPVSAIVINGGFTGFPITKAQDGPTDYLNGGLAHENLSSVNGLAGSILNSQATPPALSPRSGWAPSGSAYVEPLSPDGVGRRSVQFAEDSVVLDPPQMSYNRHDSWDGVESPGRSSRGERFKAKLKSFTTTGPLQTPRSPRASESAFASTSSSPVLHRHRIPHTLSEEGSDADVEESGDEDTQRQTPKPNRRKRMKRRLKNLDLLSTPNIPRFTGDLDSPTRHGRLHSMVRGSSMPDSAEHRGGLSEGEGRDHLNGTRRRAWGRGNSWMGGHREDHGEGADSPQPSTPRLQHRRRISEMFTSGGVSDGEALAAPTSRRALFSAERSATFKGWQQVKNTFKMLGGKKKPDNFDYYKSAELIAELRAVTPAVVMFASMLQRDEHGNKRIPVLLEQLRLRITDSQPDNADKEKGSNERHSMFSIALEYGSGPSRMKWTVERSIRDIINLHARYKLSLNNNDYLQTTSHLKNRPKQPHFPFRAFPYLRGMRGVGESDDEKEVEERAQETAGEGTAAEMTAAEGTGSEMDKPSHRRQKTRIFGARRQSSGLGEAGEGSNLNPQKSEREAAQARQKFINSQRDLLEKYLKEMIHWLMFRADSNRLCRFLELSALGVRLAAEGTYHGKECYLHIQSSKGLDFRRVLTPAKVIARHTRKWFLVRQSYIVVVESPSNMNIYDVYLVDPNFKVVSKKNALKQLGAMALGEGGKKDGKQKANAEDDQDEVSGKHHTLKLYTSERKIKLFSSNGHLIRQFEQSVMDMLDQTLWYKPHRFNSFAPVRTGVFAQWLVDGRDYMWNVSRAISMAQDVIYIHDWWLSPELYMRRPAAISQKWRLDRLLQRKAREGVKVFVIIYRNVEQAIPIDSEYTKFSLLNLHPNIMVQRSPNQLKKNQFFYAHHEKICIVDHDVAFLGGIDLCFGRWDSPQHPLTDDRPTGFEPDGETPKDAEHCQLFPGKDYSNPRVLDFFKLNEPYVEMYDRSKTPRMPWHDVAMQVVGQPARDLTRHFVQRWNYLRRERRPTRPTPFLLPPPDANPTDLENVGLTGTCEVQILRSAGDWSLGYPKDMTEQSIQSAYVKLIEQSEHFVYMENQFFITSTETLGTKVVNRIGDALVERIIRAYENDEDWQCCIMIPLMPGFQNTVDQDAGSSVRLIMQFQYRSICRGPNSIFGRLKAAGIEPEDYIQFFSLRQWGKIGNNTLVTEQLYIHAKTIIVDDRIVLIGSANINERSMLGNRDSEVAAIVRDTDMIHSTMAGRPYRVGRYAHSLRMRLMREHLGLDVDEITEEERQEAADVEARYEAEMQHIYGDDDGSAAEGSSRPKRAPMTHTSSYNHEAIPAHKDAGSPPSSSSSSSSAASAEQDARVTGNEKHEADVEGSGADHWKTAREKGLDQGRDTMVIGGREVLVSQLKDKEKAKPVTAFSNSKECWDTDTNKGNDELPPPPSLERKTTAQLGLTSITHLPQLPMSDDTDIGGPPLLFDVAGRPTNETNPLAADIQLAKIDKDCMRDPINPAFWDDVWNRIAANNTKLYRRVFRCMPDSEVLTWNEYRDYTDYSLRFHESMTGRTKSDEAEAKCSVGHVANGCAGAGIAAPSAVHDAIAMSEKMQEKQKAEAHPQLVVSNGDGTINEKPCHPDTSQPEQVQKPSLNLDMDAEKVNHNHQIEAPSPVQPAGDTPFPAYDGQVDHQLLEPIGHNSSNQKGTHATRDRQTTFSSVDKPASFLGGSVNNHSNINNSSIYNTTGSTRRRRRGTTKGSNRRGAVFPYEVLGRDEAEELCGMIQGTVVQFPYDWLESEEKDNHWLFQADLLAPKEIYD